MKSQHWFKKILSYSGRCKGKLILSIIFALISVIGGIIPYACAYKILVLFFNNTQTVDQIWFWSLISIGGFLVKAVFHSISTTLSHVSAYTILESMRLSIADKIMKAPLGVVQSQNIGKLKNVIIDHVETIELPLAHIIPEGTASFILPLGVFIYLCAVDFRMAIASLITVPLSAIPYMIMSKNFNTTYNKYMKSSDYMNGVIVEYVEGIEVVKAFNQSTSSYEKFKKAVESFRDTTLEWFQSTWTLRTLGNAILPSTLLGVLPFGMYLYMRDNISPATITISMLLSMGIVGCLGKFTTFINNIKAIEYSVSSLEEFTSLEELQNQQVPVQFNDYSVELKNVSFSYTGKLEDMVLHNINLKLPNGSFSALVGPSGGGKSTVARLIARFWDVTSGDIFIGGNNIKDIPLTQLADTVSFVTQDNFLFNCSLLENIRLGNPKATDEEVYNASKKAQCHEFILELGNGYNTLAGEAGGKLSGGQRQRIAIARAILKDAPIIILDEATAFTDPENEDKLQQSITALTQGKMLLVIAHRLSTIKNADQIIVLKKGNIEDKGSHEELLTNSELYTKMWQAHIGAKNWAVGSNERVASV